MHNNRHPADKPPPPRETLPYQLGRGFRRQTALPGAADRAAPSDHAPGTRAAPILYSFRFPACSYSQL